MKYRLLNRLRTFGRALWLNLLSAFALIVGAAIAIVACILIRRAAWPAGTLPVPTMILLCAIGMVIFLIGFMLVAALIPPLRRDIWQNY